MPLEAALQPALAALAAGEVVALPTETVYGLAGDATNGEAVARIFEAKGRPRFNPLIVHVASLDMAKEIAVFDDASLKLAHMFWPGPLTLVLKLRSGCRRVLRARSSPRSAGRWRPRRPIPPAASAPPRQRR
jgi:L-threonylcarbamoyladenylate synthase